MELAREIMMQSSVHGRVETWRFGNGPIVRHAARDCVFRFQKA
jgi:hypothetical protein